jgi:hypothetical protein
MSWLSIQEGSDPKKANKSPIKAGLSSQSASIFDLIWQGSRVRLFPALAYKGTDNKAVRPEKESIANNPDWIKWRITTEYRYRDLSDIR